MIKIKSKNVADNTIQINIGEIPEKLFGIPYEKLAKWALVSGLIMGAFAGAIWSIIYLGN